MFSNIRKMDMGCSFFNFSSVSNLLLLLFIYVTLFGSSYLEIIRLGSCSEDLMINVKCMDKERKALVALKEGLSDPSERLVSWVGEDCCKWRGIRCNNVSGHVIMLDLRNPFPSSSYGSSLLAQGDTTAYERSCLGGEIKSSLIQLKYLNYLDLSWNDFEGLQIPKFFGELENLRYLNLSHASFSGEIPPHLGNLSRLNFLDLYMNFFIRAENFRWLSGLSSLKHLNLGEVTLNSVGADWLQAVNMLPLLMELHLPWCELQILPLSLPSINFTSISIIDLSQNSFNSSTPWWLFNLTSLKKLDLSYNSLIGPIPGRIGSLMSLEELNLSGNNYNGELPISMGNLCKLKVLGLAANYFTGHTDEFFSSFSGCPSNSLVSLDISSNSLEGELPDSLGRLEYLKYLRLSMNSFWGSIPSSVGKLLSLQEFDLSFNQMNGSIPESFGQLSELIHLNLISNNWTGVITEAQLMNLGNLEDITLNTNRNMSFVFNVTYEWVPPFRLKSLYIQGCQVGPKFPVWLQVQSELTDVVLMNVGISDTIPEEWFSKLSSQITNLDLSRNQIMGKLPHQLVSPKLYLIDLRYNRFEGPLPLWSSNVTHLFLQSNLFSGPIPTNIGQLVPAVLYIYLSENRLNGSIPSSIGELKSLQVLSLRNNQLSGELPGDWSDMQSLWVFDVANNDLSGKIPTSMASLSYLQILSLSNNNLDGEVPSSLQNCSRLVSIDLGENKFSGNLPLWLGENVTLLWMLRLRSNSFNGIIPQRLCNLSTIHILDLAHNNFSGVIPKCLGSLATLVHDNSSSMYAMFGRLHRYFYIEQAIVVAKGRELQYEDTLKYVNSIDLSGNNLTGRIPEQITSLSALGILNLSMNHLTGNIPDSIGNLRWLETLDLSNNHLSGPIPGSISSLTSLNHFNLSNNNLVGRIPSGNQLQTLNDSSIYEGNPLLCGVPLPMKCPGDDDTNDGQTSEDEGKEDSSDSEMTWFYIGLGPGFVVGFWVVCGTLLVKKRWRYAYFRFIDQVGNRIALMIALKVASVRRTMGMEQN